MAFVMAMLVANNAEAPVSRLTLQPGINTLGRAEGNHLVVPHSSVSSRHCEVIVNDGSILVRDLGSTNGTFVNDAPIAQSAIANGERLKLGSVEFLVEAPELAASGSGPLRVNITKNVSTVETADAPPIARTAQDVVAAINPAYYEEPSFYSSLPRAVTYPFNKRGMLLLSIGAIFFLIMEAASRFVFIFKVTIFVFTYGYLFAYMQRIVSASAQGEDDVPDFPDVTEFWSDIFLPFLLFTGTFVVSFAPAIAVAIWMRDSELFGVAVIGTIALGALYFPMALLAVAVTDNFLALSPHVVVPSIARIILPYLLACVVLGLLVGIRFGVDWSLELVPVPIVPSIIEGFISLYLLVIEMRVLGLMFRSYRERLGWL